MNESLSLIHLGFPQSDKLSRQQYRKMIVIDRNSYFHFRLNDSDSRARDAMTSFFSGISWWLIASLKLKYFTILFFSQFKKKYHSILFSFYMILLMTM